MVLPNNSKKMKWKTPTNWNNDYTIRTYSKSKTILVISQLRELANQFRESDPLQ